MALAPVTQSSPSALVRGRWVRNTLYQSKLANNNRNRLFDDFAESVQYPRIDLDHIVWAARKAQHSWRQSARPPVEEPLTTKCLITKLPNEVLLQIFRYLLPVDQSFHIFDYTNDRGKPATMIHRLCRTCDEGRVCDPVAGNAQLHLTALATVCHALSDVYHTVMYGDNRFIFEMGVGYSSKWPRPIAKSHTGLHDVESWARIYDKTHRCLWPLSPHTSAYVKDMTIMVTKSYQEANKYERIYLTDQLNQVTALLNSARSLTHLTVDMSTPNGPHEQISQRLGWKVNGEDDHILQLREIIRCSSSCEDCGGFETFWQILGESRCKQQVVLSGHISTELASQLGATMVAA